MIGGMASTTVGDVAALFRRNEVWTSGDEGGTWTLAPFSSVLTGMNLISVDWFLPCTLNLTV